MNFTKKKNQNIIFASLIGIALINELYFVITLKNDNKKSDYKPNTKDKQIYKKILYWLTQYTNFSNLLLLCFYITDKKYFLYISAPMLCAVSIMYWNVLAKHSYTSFLNYFTKLQLHLLSTCMVLYEVLINKISVGTMMWSIVNQAIALGFILLNKLFRNTWLYNILNLTKKSGWLYYGIASAIEAGSRFLLQNRTIKFPKS